MTTVSSRLDRLLTLLPYLARNQGVSLPELASRAGVPPAVVLSDLQTLMMCGVPPYAPSDFVGTRVEGERVYLRFAEHFERPVRWTLPEALALQVALELLPAGARGPFRDEAARLAGKIESALPGPARDRVRSLRSRTISRDDPAAEVFAAVRRGLETDRRIRLEYFAVGRDELASREVSPHALFEDEGRWYLAAHCHLRDGLRFFRVDRIRGAEVLASAARAPQDGTDGVRREFERWRETPSDRVRIHFRAAAAPYVREAFGGLAVREVGEGKVELTLSCRGVTWLVPWLLPFGDGARVLEPDSLVRAVQDACRSILAEYD
ncbi:MAG: WYL domain-containing protein [Planctomycetes bacterium]|nr:WYL domain-containing protein [Planctomycetota bacterium]